MKPVSLPAYPIRNISAPNAVMLDTLSGNGSTLIVCEQTDLICYSGEICRTGGFN